MRPKKAAKTKAKRKAQKLKKLTAKQRFALKQERERKKLVDELYAVAPIYLDQLHDGKQEQLGIELYDAVHLAAKLYVDVYKPRGLKTPTKGAWLSHGIKQKSEKHEKTLWVEKPDGSTKPHRGENDYVCLFCKVSLATLGWNDGVRSLPVAFVDKLYTHANWCAMQFIKRYVEGNDEEYKLAYHPNALLKRSTGMTANMLAAKLEDDRRLLGEQLRIKMPLDKTLKLELKPRDYL